MRPPAEVTQDITVDTEIRMPGNCLQAAIASLLGMDLDDVPHFVALGHFWEWAMNAWFKEQGLVWAQKHRSYRPTGHHLIGGRSPRNVMHAVVGFQGEIVFDPHPSRAGLLPHSDEPGRGWSNIFIWPQGTEGPWTVNHD